MYDLKVIGYLKYYVRCPFRHLNMLLDVTKDATCNSWLLFIVKNQPVVRVV